MNEDVTAREVTWTRVNFNFRFPDVPGKSSPAFSSFKFTSRSQRDDVRNLLRAALPKPRVVVARSEIQKRTGY